MSEPLIKAWLGITPARTWTNSRNKCQPEILWKATGNGSIETVEKGNDVHGTSNLLAFPVAAFKQYDTRDGDRPLGNDDGNEHSV